jgi:hypothetical protein
LGNEEVPGTDGSAEIGQDARAGAAVAHANNHGQEREQKRYVVADERVEQVTQAKGDEGGEQRSGVTVGGGVGCEAEAGKLHVV